MVCRLCYWLVLLAETAVLSGRGRMRHQWCGHCKKLAPEYTKAAATLLGGKPRHRVAKVDATVSPRLKARYKIQGFPTLKVGRAVSLKLLAAATLIVVVCASSQMVRTDDKVIDYSGDRTAE